jgi:hypothetical protein
MVGVWGLAVGLVDVLGRLEERWRVHLRGKGFLVGWMAINWRPGINVSKDIVIMSIQSIARCCTRARECLFWGCEYCMRVNIPPAERSVVGTALRTRSKP